MRVCPTLLLAVVLEALPGIAVGNSDEGGPCVHEGGACSNADGHDTGRVALAEVSSSRGQRSWYGWQIWTADASSAAIGFAVMSQAPAYSGDASPRLGYVSATFRLSGMLAAPGIHFAHGNVSGGLLSLAMRIAAPWPLMPALYGCRYEYSSECMQRTTQWVSLASLLAISAFDGAFLAHTSERSNRENEREWYGWQGLIVDGTALGMGLSLAIANAHRRDQSSVPFPGYVFLPVWAVGTIAGPVMHWSHGRVGVGFTSLALRLAGGIAMAAVPLWISDCIATHSLCRNDHLEPMLAWSILSGQLAVTLIDDLVLARRDGGTAASKSANSWYFAPTLRGAVFGASF